MDMTEFFTKAAEIFESDEYKPYIDFVSYVNSVHDGILTIEPMKVDVKKDTGSLLIKRTDKDAYIVVETYMAPNMEVVRSQTPSNNTPLIPHTDRESNAFGKGVNGMTTLCSNASIYRVQEMLLSDLPEFSYLRKSQIQSRKHGLAS